MVKINSHKSKIFLCFLLTQTQHEKMFEVLLLFATVIRQTAGITFKTISLYIICKNKPCIDLELP